MKNIFSFLIAGLFVLMTACQQNRQAQSADFQAETGIIGGNPVLESDPVAPFVVGLYDEEHHSTCTGSILSETLILTAAHCVFPGSKGLWIVFSRNMFNGFQFDRSHAVLAAHFLRHPDFNENREAGENTFDLALIRFSGGLPRGFQKVSLDSKFSPPAPAGVGFLATGFGVSSGAFQTGKGILRSVSVPFLKLHSTSEIETDQSKAGVCSGDSGGPLFQNNAGQWKQVGVASRVSNHALFCGDFAVFTRVDVYAEWLESERSL